MCGIVGQINLDGEPVSSAVLKRMTDSIIHRGPDGEGQWVEGSIGLGHRRLAIIDTSSAGKQPMISADHRFVLTYNGEVYNFRELRTELEAKGYQFNSQTDSEVVLSALAEWGEGAFIKFNGMFALALWDRKEKILLLGRDRYGIKPLYYSHKEQTLLFGSEQKAIFEQPAFDRKINKKALLEYFTFQNIFTDQTLTQGVSILPAGHFAKLSLKQVNPHLVKTCYWDLKFTEPDKPAAKEEYLEELETDYLSRPFVDNL